MKNYQKDSGEKNVKAPKSCWVWLIEAKEKNYDVQTDELEVTNVNMNLKNISIW